MPCTTSLFKESFILFITFSKSLILMLSPCPLLSAWAATTWDTGLRCHVVVMLGVAAGTLLWCANPPIRGKPHGEDAASTSTSAPGRTCPPRLSPRSSCSPADHDRPVRHGPRRSWPRCGLRRDVVGGPGQCRVGPVVGRLRRPVPLDLPVVGRRSPSAP